MKAPGANAVRVATREDRDAVTGLIAGFRDFYGDSDPSDERIAAAVAELIEDEQTEFLLAGEPPVGVAQLRFRPALWTGSDDAWLEDLFVAEPARRSGVGRLLVEACVGRARERGCRRIQLDTNEDNDAALALYGSLGFVNAKREDSGGRDLFLTRWL
jgi:ribosomal protein S18 acetylase RimI-like enzyme